MELVKPSVFPAMEGCQKVSIFDTSFRVLDKHLSIKKYIFNSDNGQFGRNTQLVNYIRRKLGWIKLKNDPYSNNLDNLESDDLLSSINNMDDISLVELLQAVVYFMVLVIYRTPLNESNSLIKEDNKIFIIASYLKFIYKDLKNDE